MPCIQYLTAKVKHHDQEFNAVISEHSSNTFIFGFSQLPVTTSTHMSFASLKAIADMLNLAVAVHEQRIAADMEHQDND